MELEICLTPSLIACVSCISHDRQLVIDLSILLSRCATPSEGRLTYSGVCMHHLSPCIQCFRFTVLYAITPTYTWASQYRGLRHSRDVTSLASWPRLSDNCELRIGSLVATSPPSSTHGYVYPTQANRLSHGPVTGKIISGIDAKHRCRMPVESRSVLPVTSFVALFNFFRSPSSTSTSTLLGTLESVTKVRTPELTRHRQWRSRCRPFLVPCLPPPQPSHSSCKPRYMVIVQ
ncbi:hypothetical protein F4808DRAFT_214075 [Astrocystis sublimbata]|nr:hypothetical protein F4808DRAFT_214075 [Astrocystis sublimbata]